MENINRKTIVQIDAQSEKNLNEFIETVKNQIEAVKVPIAGYCAVSANPTIPRDCYCMCT